jgi:hypothetical protein
MAALPDSKAKSPKKTPIKETKRKTNTKKERAKASIAYS